MTNDQAASLNGRLLTANGRPLTILLRAPNPIGDIVMATPAFRALRHHFPADQITLLIRSYGREVLEGAPWFDEVIEIKGCRTREIFSALVLKKRHFDLGILFTNSFSTALSMRLSGAKRRVGYDRQARGLLLTDKIEPLRKGRKFLPVPAVDYYLGLTQYLGIPVEDKRLELFVTAEASDKAEQILRKFGIARDDTVIVLNPGAAYGSAKLWPTEYFAELADLLAEKLDARIILSGSPAERTILDLIQTAMKTRPVNLTTEEVSISLVKAVVARASLLITNDTGPRHFAAAFDIPEVTIFGSSDPAWTENGHTKAIHIWEEVDCRPCNLRKCPIDHRCMRRLKPERVFVAAQEALQRWPLKK
jgi:heptosyltransferase-2